MPMIGFLNGQNPVDFTHMVAAFREALGAAGHVEGRNVTIEFRWAEGHYDRLPALAADLVSRRVSVIATGGAQAAAVAAKGATTTIPIVFLTGGDPVKSGLVASLAKPGANVTGVSFLGNTLAAKRLELLHEVVPSATVIGLLVNPTGALSEWETEDFEAAARALGLSVHTESAGSEGQIDAAFARFVQRRVGALFITGDGFFGARRRQLAALALRHALPMSVTSRANVEAGALFGYSPNSVDAYRQVGTYVGRILKGQKPADLPVLQPAKFDFVINLATAKALGLNVPDKLITLADEVIE